MGILSGGGGSANFDRLLESATSQLQLEPNWANILEICDSIRQKDVTAKYAVTAIRRRMKDPNPHVAKFALVTLEACMKNCGEPMHDEVASREFMDELRVILKSGSEPVKEQILSMVQTWNQTLGKKSTYRIIQDTYNLLKAEGYAFPQLNESDAMYLAETAPEWAEGDNCHQCRVKFTTFTRQHHCRCCGQVFCAKCSAKNSIIPKYGIEREVRVCDACYDSINPSGPEKPGTSSKDTQSMDNDDLPAEYLNSSLAKEAQTKPKASDADIKAQEEEEFQLAMALSLSAAETEQQQAPKRNFASTTAPDTSYSSPSSASLYSDLKSNLYTDVVTDSKKASNSSDGELSHYLNRDYWEKRKDGRSAEPSAPVVHEVEEVVARGAPAYASVEEEDHDDDGQNSDAFVKTFSNSIEMFINRIQTVKSKGKHIAMDSTVQNLFQSLSAMHPQLMTLIEDEEDNKAKYEAMLQKVALVREARESLDSMRNQHREKLNHQELEQEMLRRMQMEQKLELMRQQKQEYLEYQRQLQIQRQQEIEQQQQFKLQQKQFLPQYGYEAGADAYGGGSAYPITADQQVQPAHMMQYQKQQQQQQQQGQYAEHQQPGYGQRSEQMTQEPTMQGQQMVQRQATQSQGGQTGYMAQGQMQATMTQQPQQAPYSEAQPPGVAYQPSQQQPVQYPTKAPDLLDTPIGEDLGQQQREAQSQGYSNQPFQQQSVKYRQNQEQQVSQQHQQQQRVSPQQQHYQPQQQQNQAPMSYQVQAQQPSSTQQQPASMQQQPGRMHQQPGSVQQQPGGMQQQPGGMQQQPGRMHQQPGSMQQQPGSMQQQPGGMQQQPGSIQQQPGGMQQQPGSMQQQPGGMQQQPGGMQQQPGGMQQQAGRIQQQAGNMQQQPYPHAAISTAQTTTHPSYPNQPQLQSYPESSTYAQQQQLPGNVPNQYSNQQLPRSQQGPASLPYDGQPRNQGVPGPASLPASLNQYPGGHQGYAGDTGYPQNPQQTAYIQQQQTRPQDQHITEAMKDLQLISFE